MATVLAVDQISADSNPTVENFVFAQFKHCEGCLGLVIGLI